MRLNGIFVFWLVGFVLVGEMPGADIPSPRTTTAPTNSPPRLSDNIFVWDSTTQRIMATTERPVEFTFSFANVSANSVTILGVRPSCDYVTAQLPPLPWTIAPGGTGKIGVTANLAGKSGTLFRSVLVITDKGSKLLSVKMTVLPTATSTRTGDTRAHNLIIAQNDRQAVFKGECASCHAKALTGKFGKNLYDTACGICHDAEDRATMVTDLSKINQPTSAEFWRTWIEHGKDGTLMPAFAMSEGGPLTENQIKSLTNYLAKAMSSH